MEIKLDAEAAASIASAAIFNSMTQDQRDSVLKQAVAALLVPKQDRHTYGYGKTALQLAFEQAVQQAAFQAVNEKIRDEPAIAAKIDELLGPLIRGVIEEQSKKYDDSLSDAIGRAIGAWLAEKSRGE